VSAGVGQFARAADRSRNAMVRRSARGGLPL